jgi:hypothetical protein
MNFFKSKKNIPSADHQTESESDQIEEIRRGINKL